MYATMGPALNTLLLAAFGRQNQKAKITCLWPRPKGALFWPGLAPEPSHPCLPARLAAMLPISCQCVCCTLASLRRKLCAVCSACVTACARKHTSTATCLLPDAPLPEAALRQVRPQLNSCEL